MSVLFHMDAVAFCCFLLNNYFNVIPSCEFWSCFYVSSEVLFYGIEFPTRLWWWIHPVLRSVIVPHSFLVVLIIE